MKYLLPVLFLSFLLVSCQKETDTDNPNPVTEAVTQLNVAYGTDPQQKMDILPPRRPINRNHQGHDHDPWRRLDPGDKSEFTTYVDTLKKRIPGYAIFNINYRLANGTANFFPTQENDAKAALDFIYAKRNEYKISDTWVLLGASAGGHLALLQAYKYTTPVKIKAVVDFFGPTQLTNMYNFPANPLIPLLLIQVTGGNPTTHATLYQQSSPMSFITAQSPPTIILHGGADIVVAPAQSVMLRDQLQASAVPNQYVFYPTESHGWTGANMIDSFDKIMAFLSTHVN